jgi:hypothetical protein
MEIGIGIRLTLQKPLQAMLKVIPPKICFSGSNWRFQASNSLFGSVLNFFYPAVGQ